jgi:hypothetical protein
MKCTLNLTLTCVCAGRGNALDVEVPANLQYPPKNKLGEFPQLLMSDLLQPLTIPWKSSRTTSFHCGTDEMEKVLELEPRRLRDRVRSLELKDWQVFPQDANRNASVVFACRVI